MTGTQVTVVFMVAEDLHDGRGGEVIGENVQNLVPGGQAASVFNEMSPVWMPKSVFALPMASAI